MSRLLTPEPRLPRSLSAEQRATFDRDGFLTWDLGLGDAALEAILGEVEKARREAGAAQAGGLGARLRGMSRRVVARPGRVQDAWRSSPAVRGLALAPAVLALLRDLYGREPMPFQTLNFSAGTEQAPHADTIHFTSIPSGFLCGVWVALEDIDEDNGPLVYYPGSHKLPEFTMRHVGAAARRRNYPLYEAFIERAIAEHALKPAHATIRRGQAALWAANLLHGGAPVRDRARTRHSQVTHYYFEGCRYVMPILAGHNPLATWATTLWRRATRVR